MDFRINPIHFGNRIVCGVAIIAAKFLVAARSLLYID